MHIALALAIVNLSLLLAAGFAWGWPNVLLGVAVLSAVIVAFTRGIRRVRTPTDSPSPPICIAGALTGTAQHAGDP